MKYFEGKDLEKGEELMVFLGGEVIAFSKSHNLSSKVDKIDVSSKMSGDWGSSMAGSISWSVDVETLVSVTKGHLSEAKILNLEAARKPVDFEVATITRSVNKSTGEKTFVKKDIRYKGKVIITNVQSKSQQGEYATMSCSLEGVDALMDGAGNVIGSAEALAALATP